MRRAGSYNLPSIEVTLGAMVDGVKRLAAQMKEEILMQPLMGQIRKSLENGGTYQTEQRSTQIL